MNKKRKQNIIIWQTNILIATLFLMMFFLFSYLDYDRFLGQESSNNLNQTQIKAELARQWMAERFRQFSLLAEGVKHIRENKDKVALFKSYQAIDNNNFKHLYFVDRDFQAFKATGKGPVSPEEFAPVFEKVKANGQAVLTKVEFFQDTNEPLFSMVAPIYLHQAQSQEMDGILVGVVSLNSLEEKLNYTASDGPNDSGQSATWILDSDKQTILHSKQEIILNFKVDQESGGDYKNIDPISAWIDKNISGTITYTVKNKENLFLSFVKTKINDGWVIIVGRTQLGYGDFLIQNWKLEFLVLVLVAILLGLWQDWVYKRVLMPFKILKNALSSFNGGNRYLVIQDKQSHEARELAKEIRLVTDKVIAQSYNVENLIQERTKMLSELNMTMATKNKELSEINESLRTSNTNLKHKARTDMLTQLLNRQEFLSLTDALMEEANKDRFKEFSVLFIDLDNFKQYNDNFSHDIGDFVLKSISDLIQNNIRAMDVSARYGGDEFVILINHPELQASVATAERILNKIKEVKGYAGQISRMIGQAVDIPPEKILSCSIGIVHYSQDLNLNNAEELMTLADDMMYQAKKSGKARIEIYRAQETE